MQILVVGMGLIGGSICKSIKAVTEHTVYGCDVRQDVLEQALEDGSIDGTGTMEDGAYDMIIVCLHQRIAISLIQKALPRIKAGTILVKARRNTPCKRSSGWQRRSVSGRLFRQPPCGTTT